MKITKHSKGKRRIYLRQLSLLRRRRRSNAVIKARNPTKYGRKSRITTTKKKGTNLWLSVQTLKITPKSNFTLLEAPENVIQVVKQLDDCKNSNKAFFTHLKIELENITDIDVGAICILLSKVHELAISGKRIRIWGTLPKQEKCKRIFEESGFLDYMSTISGQKFKKKSENLMVRVGYDKTENERVGKHIKQAMKFLTGQEHHYQPVFSMVQEMCANSVEHANTKGKNWLFGINYVNNEDPSKKSILFTLTDMGYGILNTIYRKWPIKVAEAATSDKDILLHAFKKKYGSKTEDKNRNKGLPRILSMSERKLVVDMVVITNNVLLDFENHDNSKVLNKKLPGTFYQWKVNLNCISACPQTKKLLS